MIIFADWSFAMPYEIKLILLSICLLVATGEGNFVYAVALAFAWAGVSFFCQLFFKL
jgi:hypothetical protein